MNGLLDQTGETDRRGMYTADFTVSVEVVPPPGADAAPLLSTLVSLKGLSFNGFSVATNPVAKPYMSAMAVCSLIQSYTGKPAVLHLTTRDHNRLSLQGELWGAKALGIETVMICTGDFVAMKDRGITSTVRDLDLYPLIGMARAAGLRTGVVFDIHPELNGLKKAVKHLEKKVAEGAQFAVTQPVYDEEGADVILNAVGHLGIPLIMGILPLRTFKHAVFLHEKVAGISVPEALRSRMEKAADPVKEGSLNAREMLSLAKNRFKGACVMPPFNHYEVLQDILTVE
jgi:homocysteine S-methyltransferase